MATNYQHRWGQTEDSRQRSRKASSQPVVQGIQIAICPACGKSQSAHRFEDYGCSKCGVPAKVARAWYR